MADKKTEKKAEKVIKPLADLQKELLEARRGLIEGYSSKPTQNQRL